MKGSDVPYQLRPNKYVDRQLLLEILDHVRLWNGPCKYLYASMGGRFLADFRTINERFAVDRMISIEADPVVVERQKFNCPLGNIECRHQTSDDFVTDFDELTQEGSDAKFVVWLDYSVANERFAQLQEFERLVAKLSAGDVVKITLNANYTTIRERSEIKRDRDYAKVIVGELHESLDRYFPEDATELQTMNAKTFAQLLAGAVKIAALNGIGLPGALEIRPLGAFRYQDGHHQMLTITAIVADDQIAKQVDADGVFAEWTFRAKDWLDIRPISVPDLSPKERMEIDRMLLNESNDEIHAKLPFQLDSDEKKSLERLSSYALHYRHYPTFGRINF